MAAVSLALGILGWLCLALLGLMLARLGRFYETRAGRRTYYRVFALCSLGFLSGGLWDVVTGGGAPGWPSSVILAGSGVLLGLGAGHLFGLMLGGAN